VAHCAIAVEEEVVGGHGRDNAPRCWVSLALFRTLEDLLGVDGRGSNDVSFVFILWFGGNYTKTELFVSQEMKGVREHRPYFL